MAERVYPLTDAEKTRLRAGLEAAFTVPIIDDVEDFVWEAVFHHVKGLRLPDPILQGRTKQLFDAVAPDGRGWSLKTLLWARHTPGSSFEFVIQRADIFKKGAALGFPNGLTAKSQVAELGAALIRHWNAKFETDSRAQKVTDPRIVILLKNATRKRFVYVEFAYPSLNEKDYTWRWTREDGFGLQGIKDGQVRFKWYHGQKQFFQVYQIPREAYAFDLDWQRASLGDFVENVRRTLSR